MSVREKRSSRRSGDANIPVTEWIVAGIGFILVSAAVGYLLYLEFTRGSEPPHLVIEAESVFALQDGYAVRFVVTNLGDRTAEGVFIEGELTKDGRAVEVSQVEIDYAPAHSKRRGTLLFTRDPSGFTLQLRSLGFEEP